MAEVVEGSGSNMSYYHLCEAMRVELPGLPERSVYYVLMTLCPGGRVRAHKLRAAAAQCSREPPFILYLWVMYSFRKDHWRLLTEAWSLAAAAAQGMANPHSVMLPLAREDFVELCMSICDQVGRLQRARWEETAKGLDPEASGFVSWPAVTAALDTLGS